MATVHLIYDDATKRVSILETKDEVGEIVTVTTETGVGIIDRMTIQCLRRGNISGDLLAGGRADCAESMWMEYRQVATMRPHDHEKESK